MKKVLINIGRILLRLLILIIIVVNKKGFFILESVALIGAILWVVAIEILEHVIMDKKTGKKKGRVGFYITDVLAVLIIFATLVMNPNWNSTPSDKIDWSKDTGNVTYSNLQALEDYMYMLKYVKKLHPLTHDGFDDEIMDKILEVKHDLENTDSIKGYDLCRELESILSALGDGHTSIQETYPEYHYMKHNYEHRFLGDTLVAVNGLTYEDMLNANPYIVSYERTEYGEKMIKNRVSSLEGLNYLGIDTSGEIVYNYRTADGGTAEERVTAEDFLTYDEYIKYSEEVTGDDLSSEGEDRGFVYYDIYEDADLAVLTLTSCNYNAKYKETVKAMFDEIHEKNIGNVAVDLTDNGGGSSGVANEFIKYLDVDSYYSWPDAVRFGPVMVKHKKNLVKNHKKGYGFNGNVYVITSIWSYSASMDFAMLIQDNGIGKVVGEASGNMPNSYGQITRFVLPNSGLIMQVSTKDWHRVDETKEDLPVLPDIECNPYEAVDVIKEITRK